MARTDLDLPQKGPSRTWLVAVMHGDDCLTAEFLSGSRNYIPRLIEICHILVSNTTNLDGYEVILARDDWRNTLIDEDIRKFAGAWAVMT